MIKKATISYWLAVLGCILSATGCSWTYVSEQAKSLKDCERAIIKGEENKNIHFLRLDGEYVWVGTARPLTLIVPPGKHTMHVGVFYGSICAYADLSVIAEAGRTYVVKAQKEKGDPVRFWIEDGAQSKF